MNSEIFYFPGWTRKSISFTIDDGNVPLDRKFLDIVKPAGILGTFNLCANERYGLSAEQYRELYRGYEIANHCKLHPFSFDPLCQYKYSDGAFDAQTSDPDYLYKTDVPGVYHYNYNRKYWSYVATTEAYCALAEQSRKELIEIFGEGSVVSFVWPYGKQKDEKVMEYLASNYYSVRKTTDSDFNLPSDRANWSYNAHHTNLNEKAKVFEELSDDGKLHWFCFGVHSHDFENNNCWDVLERFAENYGNRPEEFYYATVRDIFEYEDAINSATLTDSEVVNNSDKVLYIKIGGKRITLFPNSTYKF